MIHSKLYKLSTDIKIIANLLNIRFSLIWKACYINISTKKKKPCKTNQKSDVLVGTRNHLNIATDSAGCRSVGIHCPDPDISGGKGRATLSGLTREVSG